MTIHHKKLFIFLGIFIIVLGAFLVRAFQSSLAITTQSTDTPLFSANPIAIAIQPTDQVLGNPGAPLTIIEFTDLGNADARALHETFSNFVKKHPRDARLIFKHAPVYHFFSDTVLAHQAAYCAGKQNKLWNFLDALINNNNLRESGLRASATTAGIDINNWWICTNSVETQQAVQKDLTEAQSLQAGKPPLIFINNKQLNILKGIDITQLLTSLIQP
jgi:protein-disulfide isomerase